MKEKRNYKKEIKEWWNEHKRPIKAGIICGLLGIGYGFVKGMSAANKSWINGLGKTLNDANEEPCDDLGLTESNCDDPELLELVRFENENA